MKAFLLVWFCSLGSALSMIGATLSPLAARGYTALPSPQRVELGSGDVPFGAGWRLDAPAELSNDIAVREFNRLLSERFHLALNSAESASSRGVVHLAIAPHTVNVTGARDKEQAVLAEQAYRLTIAADEVSITGNTPTGLFYGVQTFVQLLKEQSGKLWLPTAKIDDWPDMELRVIYWDDAHHLEHMDVLKTAIRQAAFYKINGFSIKLEGHFQFQHAQPIVDPYALTPSELQELTDYALEYHIQLIPYLDGPAHVSFILKHPEYADLREYPENNYEFCVTNPKTYELLDGMFDDLLAANKGGKYFILSTDEPYYVGLAKNAQCQEADKAKQLGSVGKLLAEFTKKTADYLHSQGRQVIFWGEYPLKANDIAALPNYLINGEVYGPQFDPVFREHGIRQMIYTSTEGEEQLFPQYYVLPKQYLVQGGPHDSENGRVKDMIDSILFTSKSALSSTRPDSAQAQQADLLGVFIAGWADPGLHPETFWLGYATGPAAGWNPQSANPQELQSNFYRLFYGSGSANMGRLYQLMSEGAQFWEYSWDKGPSKARKPIWGNSYKQFHPPQPASDNSLPPLPVPSADGLRLSSDWRAENARRLDLANRFFAENEELLDLLHANVQRAQFNRYNLAVYLSIADLYRQNLTMIEDLGRIADSLKKAEQAASGNKAPQAIEALDRALDLAASIRESRNKVLKDTTETWYESWFPRVAEANGRKYLNEVDDVKDHQPMRTVDMSYLIYRELLYPLGDWVTKVVANRNQYAKAHRLSAREFTFDWQNYATE